MPRRRSDRLWPTFKVDKFDKTGLWWVMSWDDWWRSCVAERGRKRERESTHTHTHTHYTHTHTHRHQLQRLALSYFLVNDVRCFRSTREASGYPHPSVCHPVLSVLSLSPSPPTKPILWLIDWLKIDSNSFFRFCEWLESLRVVHSQEFEAEVKKSVCWVTRE